VPRSELIATGNSLPSSGIANSRRAIKQQPIARYAIQFQTVTTRMSAKKTTFKLVLIGDAKVGKSSFVKRNSSSTFDRDYTATQGVAVTPLTVETSAGSLTFNIWDTAGERSLGPLYEGVYLEADCGILMFDVTDHATYRNIATWYNDLVRVRPMVQVVLVGNKVDVRERKVSASQVTFHKARGIQYIEISAKSGLHSDSPLEALAQRLLGDTELTLVPRSPSQSPDADPSSPPDAGEVVKPSFSFTFSFKPKVEAPAEQKPAEKPPKEAGKHGKLSFGSAPTSRPDSNA
jgi:GTP-binding nuclear protein Ran